jgi:hypothetical protein
MSKDKFRPKDQQWIQEMCELVQNKLPENYTFVVFAFPTGESDRMYYASNSTRESAIAALKEWITYQEKTKSNWMKHDPRNIEGNNET